MLGQSRCLPVRTKLIWSSHKLMNIRILVRLLGALLIRLLASVYLIYEYFRLLCLHFRHYLSSGGHGGAILKRWG